MTANHPIDRISAAPEAQTLDESCAELSPETALPTHDFPSTTIQASQEAPPDAAALPPRVSAWGCREASTELHDACVRAAEFFDAVDGNPALFVSLDDKLKVQLMTTRLVVQQALDHARRCS